MIKYIFISLKLVWQVVINWLYYQVYFKKKINNYLLTADNTFTKSDAKKMRLFAIIIPVFVGYGCSLLKNKKISAGKRFQLIQFSLATPLFDDFFDDEKLSVTRLDNLFNQQQLFTPTNTKEQVFFDLIMQVKNKAINDDAFFMLCKSVFIEQQQAVNHLQTKISYETLLQQSFKKCEQSTLMFWHLLFDEITESEKKAVIQLGRLIQFADDIFDVWFDLQTNTQTVATNTNSISQLETDFNNEWILLKQNISNLSMPQESKANFLRLQFLLFSSTFVALQQLKNLPITTQEFNPEQYVRKQLVCDMAQTKNRIAWLKILYKTRNQF